VKLIHVRTGYKVFYGSRSGIILDLLQAKDGKYYVITDSGDSALIYRSKLGDYCWGAEPDNILYVSIAVLSRKRIQRRKSLVRAEPATGYVGVGFHEKIYEALLSRYRHLESCSEQSASEIVHAYVYHKLT